MQFSFWQMVWTFFFPLWAGGMYLLGLFLGLRRGKKERREAETASNFWRVRCQALQTENAELRGRLGHYETLGTAIFSTRHVN